MTGSPFDEAVLSRARDLGLTVLPEVLRKLERYYSLLSRWNKRINLTALPLEDFPAATLDRMFFEPLAAAEVLPGRTGSWFDVGSGGGSPAIPLKLVRPGLTLSMVEAKARKTAFLREAVRQLDLDDTEVITGRLEEVVPLNTGTADIVTARALRLDRSVCSALGELLRPGGQLVVFGGVDIPAHDFLLTSESPLPGGSLLRVFSRNDS